MNQALEIRDLNGGVGAFRLKGINLELQKGTVMGLIGRNGAGKTTLVRTILDLLPRRSGEVLFDGMQMSGNEAAVKSRLGVAFDSLIYPLHLKPTSVKSMMAPLYPSFDTDRFDNLMERFSLDPTKRLNHYSKGMQMKFGVVMALCHNPDLILLDEPTAGLDPVARTELIDVLLEWMQDENKALLFSTHITSDLDRIADYITLIDGGAVVFTQEKEKLQEQYTLVSVEKACMNDKLRSALKGLKETPFGFEGLCQSRECLQGAEGIRAARPSIEQIMLYLTQNGGERVG